MLKNFRNILAFCLAQIVLFSTTSFVIDVHKCDGKVYDISVMGHAESCDMAKMSCKLELNPDSTVKSKSCCSDVRFITNGNTIKKESDARLNRSELNFSGVVNNFFSKKKHTFSVKIEYFTKTIWHYLKRIILTCSTNLF
ncbi:MAG: hypothetical protein L3J45_08990 [Flavobacteriaceae bacterium]|nr:hypothetical protein [Flavobacteriaceae bacterium]